ncbi:MAG TPA: hypothetical protein VN867_12225 [Candidatus Binataceae bacterium]|nr:hypothetical protein [Candidatus Binataceae bacterium]
MLRSWRAELAPFPNRWRRAARVAFVTALGAVVTAILQISNPLGLTLLLNFAAPEYAFSLATAITFLLGAASMQLLFLAAVGALVNAPIPHICVFIAYTFISTYLIYGVPALGRLWVWVQIPTVTLFYLVLFDHRGLGWVNAQMFAGLVVAVTMLWLFNNVIWPEPAAAVLSASVRSTQERLRHRLELLMRIFLSDGGAIPEHDRGVASKLAYHLTLLEPSIRNSVNVREPAELLATVTVAERIHNEIDRLSVVACTQLGAALDETGRLALLETARGLDAALEAHISGSDGTGSQTELLARIDGLRRIQAAPPQSDAIAGLASHFENIAALLSAQPDELPRASVQPAQRLPQPAFHLSKFLVRFCARHTIAMTIAFVAGLFDNNAALHASLWLLMIGGPPSHGGTAKKFTVRAIGAAGALLLAALGTIVLAPNFISLPPYMLAIFIGIALITYIGEGGGELSYLAVGGTAFVIAFSGPGPRTEMLGSIWTVWGVSLGMIIRAVLSVVWRERMSRTLVEEFERPLAALVTLTRSASLEQHEIVAAEMVIITGVQAMLTVATDAELEGRSAGIDARNLVDALDTTRRLAFALGNLSTAERGPERARFDTAVSERLESWLASLRAQLEPGQSNLAPLRTMVASAATPDLIAVDDLAREHIARLMLILDAQLRIVSLG